MKKLLTLSCLVIITFSAFSQQKDTGQHLIDEFFKVYTTEGPKPALDYIFGTNQWMDPNSDGVRNVIYELEKNINLIGNYIDHEELKDRKIGSRFRIVSYFVYYDRQPLRFTFSLYKNNEGWMLWNFLFDSNYDDEIEESMKLSIPLEN